MHGIAPAIPDAALDADIAILGKKGRGKTYTAKGLVERLLDDGRRVLVLDPLSTWWGLKATAKGDAGYPIVVFGGPHADIELDEGMGRGLGRFIAGEQMSAVIDLGLMRKAEQARVVADLLEELFAKNRDPIWLVLEEADAFAPQQPMGDHNMRVLGEVDRIARRGRAFGFRLISISQRAAKLHKDVLTQLSTLIALGVTSPQDRDAVKAWVEGNADRDKAREVMQSMASLPVGEGWVWAPDLDLLKRVRFPKIKTLDTSATPAAGKKRVDPKRLAQPDLTKIEAVLKADIEDARAKQKNGVTPALRAAYEDYKKVSKDELAEAEKRGYERGLADGRSEAAVALRRTFEHIRAVIDQGGCMEASLPPPKPAAVVQARPTTNCKTDDKFARLVQQRSPTAKTAPATIDGLTGPEMRMLEALAWWDAVGQASPSRAMLAAIAGWKIKSGHIKNVLGALSTKGLVSYPAPGRVAMTDAGRKEAPAPALGDLHEAVRKAMTGPQAAAFDALRRLGETSREELCAAVGWNPTSGHPKNVLGSMSSLELIEYPRPGYVRLVEWLR